MISDYQSGIHYAFTATLRPLVTITSGGGLTNQTSQVVTGTVNLADAGTTVSLYDNNGTASIGTAVVQAGGTWTTTVTLVGDGPHSLVAKDTDAAGNTGTSAPVVFTLDQDTGEQAALKLTVNGGAPIGAATAGATPFAVAGLESDDNGRVSFSDGSHTPVVVNIINGAPAASTVNLSGLNDGTITATLHLNTDAAGNSFTNISTTATLDQDKIAETPTLTAPSKLTVAAGGSVPLGVVSAVDSDDVLSVAISGVPSFESVTAAGATPTVTKHGSTFTYTFNTLPAADWNNGLILHSTYTGKGHPTNPLTVTVSNTTTGEASTASKTISVTATWPPAIPRYESAERIPPIPASKTISVTDPPAGSLGANSTSPGATIGVDSPANSSPPTSILDMTVPGETRPSASFGPMAASLVSGFTGQNLLDLADIAFGSHTTLGYAANSNNTDGTLTVSDGTHTANIALLGQSWSRLSEQFFRVDKWSLCRG